MVPASRWRLVLSFDHSLILYLNIAWLIIKILNLFRQEKIRKDLEKQTAVARVDEY